MKLQSGQKRNQTTMSTSFSATETYVDTTNCTNECSYVILCVILPLWHSGANLQVNQTYSNYSREIDLWGGRRNKSKPMPDSNQRC